MSIVALKKVTLVGHAQDKERVLADLQELGCLHLIPLTPEGGVAVEQGPSPEAWEALKFLLTCPHRRRQVTNPARFDAPAIEHRALEIRDRLQNLQDERDFLAKRIVDLEPWGDFSFPPPGELAGQRLWFYPVPHHQMKDVEATDLRWEVIRRDNRFCYVVVVSEPEPQDMPAPRTQTGSKPRHELEQRLEDVELEIEDLQAERISLTRWCTLFASSLDQLEDLAARSRAATGTCDLDPVFALQAWAPKERFEELRRYASSQGLALEVHEPEAGESPPTLLQNPPRLSGGEDLVTFYMTPGYWTWDPSSVVLLSFALFFAMILSDAGYAAALGAILLLVWPKMARSRTGRRMRSVFATVVGTALVYGVLAGSYFGVSPEPESLLGTFRVLDVTDPGSMMALSIFIGVAHLVLGNVMDAYRKGRRPEALPPLGWACIMVGGLFTAAGITLDAGVLTGTAIVLMIAGAALVFLFTGVGLKPGPRLLRGLLAFTRLSNAFGDVLSYLRLFALGLATASLAGAFNDLAGQAREAVGGAGLLVALLVLIVGHGLNFVLGLMSAVVHGLRLNVIEFFNWSLREEGNLYRPFKRKESTPWTP